jgi:signal transduction histidine kinase
MSARSNRVNWSLRRRLAVVLSATAVLLLALVTFASITLVQVHRHQDDVTNRYFTILSDSNQLYLSLVDAETAVRGYILTGDDTALQPLDTLNSPDSKARGAELRRLVAGQRTLDQKLSVVSGTAGQWYRTFVQPSIAQVRTHGARSVDAQAVNAGRVQFDLIRAQYADYRGAALAKRVAANNALRTKTDLLFVSVLLGAIAPLFLGLLLAVALRRWVTRPVDQLAEGARAVRSGELARRITVDGPPEISSLATDVEAMRERVVDQLAQVESTRDGLAEAQKQLEAKAAELQRSNRDLEQFAYVASHDLQEPLRKVASFCQLLERRYKGQLDERADQYIDFAVDGAKRMQQLINDLLSFSRIGRRTGGRGEVALDDSLTGALRNLEVVIEETGAEVIADPLPTVWGEKALLTALLQNLISNAIKFHGDRRVEVRLTVEAVVGEGGSGAGEPDEYVFRCRDNGIGIEPQYAERIFVIFQRLHGKDEYAGTGIGLAMCKKIVEWHGGRIWLDTEATGPGVGTTFAWSLPTAARGRALMDPTPERVVDGQSAAPALESTTTAHSDGQGTERSLADHVRDASTVS